MYWTKVFHVHIDTFACARAQLNHMSIKQNKFKYDFSNSRPIYHFNIFSSSLDKLTIEFNTNTKKGLFPHYFINEDTLNYKGVVPPINYYPNVDIADYNKEKNKFII